MRTIAVRMASLAALVVSTATPAQSAPGQRPPPLPQQRPQQPPAAQKPSPDTVEYKSNQFGLTFRVPKTWERHPGVGDDDSVFEFDPAPGLNKPVITRSSKPPTPKATQAFKVFLGQPCERQKDLQEVVKDTRRGLQEMIPGIKFRKDEATVIAGYPAWTFIWNEQRTVPVTEMNSGKVTEFKVNYLRQKTLWLQNDTICDYGFEASPEAYPTLERLATKVRDSFKWTKPPTAHAPAE